MRGNVTDKCEKAWTVPPPPFEAVAAFLAGPVLFAPRPTRARAFDILGGQDRVVDNADCNARGVEWKRNGSVLQGDTRERSVGKRAQTSLYRCNLSAKSSAASIDILSGSLQCSDKVRRQIHGSVGF
jgi:hypothetical protein